MAENESLELGGAYAKRWDVPFALVRNGATCGVVSRKMEDALVSGLGKSVDQFREYGVSLRDLLAQRNSRIGLAHLIRKTLGHEYVRLFADAAASSGPSESECLRGWIDAILDKTSDQICHRVAGQEHWPTFYSVADFMNEVREDLAPVVDRIVNDFLRDPEAKPKRRRSKERTLGNPTADLMGLSLLGARNP